MTKLAAVATALLAASGAAAFTTSRPGPASNNNGVAQRTAVPPSSTSLNLFGSKPKGEGADKPGGPGMMDQLAMFKKAQELAQKKQQLDKELAEEKITGTAADGKVEITVKYVPPQLPANPTPGYEAAAVNIDEGYLAEASAEELSAALVEAIREGEKNAMERVGEKYKSLEEDVKNIMGGQAAGGAQE